jgi:glycosyltransferase involved in cell wall biosynthesis
MISIFISVYNEEERIENFLESFYDLGKIYVLDKGSTDRTIEICSKYNSIQVIKLPFSQPYYANFIDEIMKEYCMTEWAVFSTASDLIHPRLVIELKAIINNPKIIDYDLIRVPFKTFVLGINSYYSPWYTKSKIYAFRKNALAVNLNGVHNGIQYSSEKIYEMNINNDFCVYHLTHKTVSSMMNRHLSYWEGEATLPLNIDLKLTFKDTIRNIFRVLLKRKSFMLGWDGIMLSFSYITYFMMKFVYQWERKRSNAKDKYLEIANNIVTEAKYYRNK